MLADNQPTEIETTTKIDRTSRLGIWTSRLLVVVSALSVLFYLWSWLGPWIFVAELACHFHFHNFWVLFLCAVGLMWTPYRAWAYGVAFFAIVASPTALGTYAPQFVWGAGGESIRIMSFNVLGSSREYERAAAEIRRINPDVLILVEYNRGWDRQMQKVLSDYPHRVVQPRDYDFGVGVFSKYPLEIIDSIRPPQNASPVPALPLRVHIGNRSVSLLAVHTLSPLVTGKLDEPSTSTWQAVGKIAEVFYNDVRMKIRNQQLVDIAELARQLDGPVVAIGDFNCTPWSPFFRKFIADSGLRDSRLGFGNQGSWPTFGYPLCIPIDHAFTSPSLRVTNRQTGFITGSDHFPIFVDIELGN